MTDPDPKHEATTREELSARRLSLGIELNQSTESTLTVFRSSEAAAAMKSRFDRLGEQAPADDIEPPDEAA